MRKYWFIILFLFTSEYSAAQLNITDSLPHVLRNHPDDSNKVRLLYGASWLYAYNQPDSGIYYADSMIRLSQKIGYLFGEVIGNQQKSVSYLTTGDYASAMFYGYQALRILEPLGDWSGLWVVNGALAGIYNELGEHKKALDYQLKIRRMLITLGDSAYSRFAGVIVAMDSVIAENDHEIARTYLEMGMTDSAFEYGSVVFSFFQNHWSAIPVLMGDIYAAKNDYTAALMHYNTITDIKNPLDSAKNLVGKANVFKQIQQQDSCRIFAIQALEISQRIKFAKGILQASEILSLLYEKSDPQESLKYLKIGNEVRESLYSKSRINQVNSIAFNDQLRQLDAIAAEKAARDKFKTWSLFGIIFTFLIAGLLLWRNNQNKKEANVLLQKEKQTVEQTLEDLRSTQSQLVQREKMASLGELTAGIAHEIQNPLNFVNNFSEVNKELVEEAEQEANKGNLEEVKFILNDIKDNSEKINHHGKRADAIVKGMLQHSRQNSGQKEATDINALCDEYLRLAYHGLRAKDKSFNATTKTEFDNSIAKINIVPQDIGRVILNLINNAFYAVNEKQKQNPYDYEPTVSVATTNQNGQVEIIVKDNGNGISQNIVDKIFQPFFTTKPTGQGTGLGLSLSYDIIKAHGGEIKVESREGEGSEFSITLPA